MIHSRKSQYSYKLFRREQWDFENRDFRGSETARPTIGKSRVKRNRQRVNSGNFVGGILLDGKYIKTRRLIPRPVKHWSRG